MLGYFRPETEDEAVAYLADAPCRIIAGCTDYYAALPTSDTEKRVLDVTGLEAARGIAETSDTIRIGSLTTWTDIVRSPLPPSFDALKQAARQIGGVQIQNAGTLGGNLCNASPAADGVPPLLILDAEVELASARGMRRLPLDDFMVSNRQTRLEADEFLRAIVVPNRAEHTGSTFQKLGARAYQVISISMVAGLLEVDGSGRIGSAAFAVGACSVKAKRLTDLEVALVGCAVEDPALDHLPIADLLHSLAPISDVRATAKYRLDATATLIRRAIHSLRGTLA